jgi:hypothetical protein
MVKEIEKLKFMKTSGLCVFLFSFLFLCMFCRVHFLGFCRLFNDHNMKFSFIGDGEMRQGGF